MPEYDQINLKLKPEEMAQWKEHADNLGVSMTQFIRNCVMLTINGENAPKVEVKLESENRKLDLLVQSQKEVITILNQLLVSRETQGQIKNHMVEIARNNVDQETLDKIMAFLKSEGAKSIKQITTAVKITESKALQAITFLESEKLINRNFMKMPNTFEVA